MQYASKLGLKVRSHYISPPINAHEDIHTQVYAVSSGSSKRELALSMGASEYIDSSTTDAVKLIQSLGGARIIVCTAPYAKHINSILPAIGKNGTVTLVSAATDAPIEVWNLLLNMNRATIRGWCCGASPDMEQCVKFSTVSSTFICLFLMSCLIILDVDVKAIVQEYPLEEYSNAYVGVMTNKARFRNVIVFP